ncbi:uncharacterized protein A4U43_C03F10330 [Asparagus officinalis]|uniref:Uncharacterized protein n=1 Tax=Asparagus officinalis TaxID=4686 RepID=A0A5P1F8U3_ASPOF|nr:uncharacterized protein A4U43_C03F10330 [Asparagus officinalis]
MVIVQSWPFPGEIIDLCSARCNKRRGSRRKKEEKMGDAGVSIISKQIVRTSPKTNGGGVERIHLSPWDLKMLPVGYVQKGILFAKQHNFPIVNLSSPPSHNSPAPLLRRWRGRLVTPTTTVRSRSLSAAPVKAPSSSMPLLLTSLYPRFKIPILFPLLSVLSSLSTES